MTFTKLKLDFKDYFLHQVYIYEIAEETPKLHIEGNYYINPGQIKTIMTKMGAIITYAYHSQSI